MRFKIDRVSRPRLIAVGIAGLFRVLARSLAGGTVRRLVGNPRSLFPCLADRRKETQQ
ncbi:MAG: hypothetical protein IM333_12095 [Microcystis sp. M048S1]|uniref:hypothetical protein n=1 Tax=Microcystis TaxID=1125 RepID=UPI0002EADD0B|nr:MULTISPECIES: hypothetical protein [Microcystis]MCA2901030.1 hypothetical protein [Microcystis sp. M035S1]MCZ8289975.1 hypothetical protein [Microcystis sp. LE19-59.1C]AOC53408.1 hypothetical protein amyaer_2699 [Microcystis aeruginosa NIES-2481]MBD2290362.1 hypothetical protein [Microcystis wesenbergii FACHB-1317]MCA2700968.1 hypothetical protein [Microcystis sp. M179S2]